MNRNQLVCVLVVALSFSQAATAAAAAEPQEIALWALVDPPATAPTEVVKDRGDAQRPNRFISDVRLPSLTVYLPPKEKASGAAVVICPGGGYSGVAIDKEGHEVARWLNLIGVAGIVLKYRMPRPDVTKDGPPLPLLDVQRAIRTVRSRASDWNIDPAKVGVMGFSAGGHLTSMAATRFHPVDTSAADPIDRLSDRPDFVILVYPVISFSDPIGHTGSRRRLLGDNPPAALAEEYSSDKRVTAQTPPAFLVHARDDKVKCENSIAFDAALKKPGVASELHLFDTGGHGFGLGADSGEVARWPALCERWLNTHVAGGTATR